METIYSIFGLIAVFCMAVYSGYAEQICRIANKEELSSIEEKDKNTIGCTAICMYSWYLWGLLTSQWFLCAVYLIFNFFESIIRRIFKIRSTPRKFYISAIFDFCFIVIIITNINWLKIDFYQLFLGIFN